MNQALLRLVVLIVVLVNQSLIVLGYEPLPFTDEQIYEAVSSVALVVVAIWTWWKNNDVTPEAKKGTEITKKLKEKKGNK